MNDIPKEVLIKASEGDLKSFEHIYKDTAGFVYNVALRIVGNKQDAEEVAQEAFLNIYHNLAGFRFQSSFKTWVYRIAVNCAINQSRRISRERARRREYGDNLNRLGKTFDEAVVGTDAESQERVAAHFLSVLNQDQRSCVVLRTIEGLSYQEIADILKININTVRTRLKRARERMINLGKEVIADGV